MLKKLLLGSVGVLALVVTTSAYADVDVLANIRKDKHVTITEHVSISKVITINAHVNLDAAKASEAGSIVNQTSRDNRACENCSEKLDQILNSVNGNHGVASVNQAAGNNNNQGNVLTASVDVGRPPEIPPPPPPPGNNTPVPGGFAHAQGHVDQENGVGTSIDAEGHISHFSSPNIVDSAQIVFRDGVIDGSIDGNFGLTMVNQAPGQMNNQANVVTIAVALAAGGVALSEADLGQETSNNVTHETDVHKLAQITNSVNTNQGVTLVNQAVGNMSNQANTLSLGAAVFVSAL